jgi:hypothetical protein
VFYNLPGWKPGRLVFFANGFYPTITQFPEILLKRLEKKVGIFSPTDADSSETFLDFFSP